MSRNLKILGPDTRKFADMGPYQEVATYIRDLLRCDYALVAVPQNDAIRVCAIAGAEPESAANIADFVTRLREWGPMVVDDSRLIAVPVMRRGRMLGVLVGYCAKPGTFTSENLQQLTDYSHVARGILTNAALAKPGSTRTSFSPEELLHFSRLATIGELSACFAHEVNNPLTLIRGHVRFVADSFPLDHPLRNSFEVIERASRRLEEMARRMLDFSRKGTPSTESCEVAELISDALCLVQPYLKAHCVDVKLHPDPDLPRIDLDRCQMVQAVVNLLQNAADSMAEAGERVLSITTRIEGDTMRIAISDTGTGIAPGNLKQIFEPFFTTKGDRGTGLGLFITKQVVEGHRGSIDVETGSRGTTFVISLPL